MVRRSGVSRSTDLAAAHAASMRDEVARQLAEVPAPEPAPTEDEPRVFTTAADTGHHPDTIAAARATGELDGYAACEGRSLVDRTGSASEWRVSGGARACDTGASPPMTAGSSPRDGYFLTTQTARFETTEVRPGSETLARFSNRTL